MLLIYKQKLLILNNNHNLNCHQIDKILLKNNYSNNEFFYIKYNLLFKLLILEVYNLIRYYYKIAFNYFLIFIHVCI